MIRFLHFVVFVVGLAAVTWIAAGYLGSHRLALSITVLIGVVYVVGAWELFRYQRTTDALARAVDGLSEPPESLATWLASVPVSVRQSVQLRVQGERTGLPGPTLAPYLVGLLVLLGMLGTFLGMVATLRGTGAALQSATDLQAIRASLAAPVMGLGFAFGTSVAGVAASAMLGLLLALCRRARMAVAQTIDGAIASPLRGYSLAHQREERVRLLAHQTDLLQRQAETLPLVADRLDALAQAMTRQAQTLNDSLLANQERFHSQTEAAYVRLASTLEHALKAGVADTTQAASAAIEPAVASTMSKLAHESAALHERVAASVQQHLDGTSARLYATGAGMAATWQQALTEQRAASEALTLHFRASLDGFAQTFDQRSGVLLDGMTTRLDGAATRLSGAWDSALEQQKQGHDALATANQLALVAAVESFDRHARELVRDVSHSQAALVQQVDERGVALADKLGHTNEALVDRLTQAHGELASRVEAAATDMVAGIGVSAADMVQRVGTCAAGLMETLHQSDADLRTAFLAGDQARATAWLESIDALARTLRDEWAQAGELTSARQQEICDALGQTARAIAIDTQAHAQATIAEIERLVQAASEAPKVAADVVIEVRKKLSESMARDNSMLEERSRLLETLGSLLDAVNHASTEQRTAVDSLVTTSADMLARVGSRFSEQVEAETGKLTGIADRVTGSAADVSGLSEAFGSAVTIFSESNDKMLTQLQRIESSLDATATRSDEQLAYYVAQARELIDLSILSQKQIVDNLQRLASGQSDARATGPEAASGTEAAAT